MSGVDGIKGKIQIARKIFLQEQASADKFAYNMW